MKVTTMIAAIAATAAALPTSLDQGLSEVELRAALEARSDIEARQVVGTTANELSSGACRPITFIFARGSTEPGNLGTTVGPATCRALKSNYGTNNVACQGVGSPYDAGVGTNALPEGTSTAAYGEAQRLFNLASTKCPDTIIVAGGYSQGAAVMTASVRRLSAAVQNQIAGVVLYGNTQNAQTNGHIPNFPSEKSTTYCALGDGVCGGGLVVTAAHLSYQDDVPTAARYLEGRITAAGGI